MVAFWRDIRTRQRPDGLPGASQTFPPAGEPAATIAAPAAASQAGEPAAAIAAPTPAEDAAALGCVSSCDGLPGPECFGTTLLPSWRHTWHLPLLGAQAGPGWSGGRSGSGDKAGLGSGGDGSGGGSGAVGTDSADNHHGIPEPSCKTETSEAIEERTGSAVAGVVEVTPAPVPSVWEEVDVRQCRAKGRALGQLKGLPAYDLCFQGF